MPIYGFQCKEHNTYEEVLCAAKGRPGTGDDGCPKCPECGKDMVEDWRPRNGRQTSTSYGSGVISDSLAISPDQIEEHHKLFPGVDVLPDGRIKFDNYKQHDNYLKQTGFRKLPQKLKGLGGVRIDK